jgi:hypothetical protein
MLAVLIYIVDAVSRSLRTVVRSVSIVAESYREAQELRRNAARHYIEE